MFKFFDDVRREVDDVVKPKRRLSAGKNAAGTPKNTTPRQSNNNSNSKLTAAKTATAETFEHANNIPKEELLHLSMKLSKRLKAIQQTNAKLVVTDKKRTARINNLENFISEIVVSPSISHLTIEEIRHKYDERYEQNLIREDAIIQENAVDEEVHDKNNTESSADNDRSDVRIDSGGNSDNIKKLSEQMERLKIENMKHIEVSRSLRDELSNLRASLKNNNNDSGTNNNMGEDEGESESGDNNALQTKISKAEEKIVLLQIRLDKLRNKEQENNAIHTKLLSDHSITSILIEGLIQRRFSAT